MPRSRHPHLVPLASEFNRAPHDVLLGERLATAVAHAARERSAKARPGDPPTAPGRAAALLIRHHVNHRHRAVVQSRVHELMAELRRKEAVSPTEQVRLLCDSELAALAVAVAREAQRRRGPSSLL
jgi:hypothetical protein